jgi:hypothetical protein
MKRKPSLNGPNGKKTSGRDKRGRFAPGNPGGPGNPLAKRANQVRSLVLSQITREDIRAVVRKLLKKARAGNMAAIREVLDRCVGKSITFAELREVENDIAECKVLRMPWEETEE